MLCSMGSLLQRQTGVTEPCCALTHLFLLRLVPEQSFYHLSDLAERRPLCRLQIPAHLHDRVAETRGKVDQNIVNRLTSETILSEAHNFHRSLFSGVRS